MEPLGHWTGMDPWAKKKWTAMRSCLLLGKNIPGVRGQSPRGIQIESFLKIGSGMWRMIAMM